MESVWQRVRMDQLISKIDTNNKKTMQEMPFDFCNKIQQNL